MLVLVYVMIIKKSIDILYIFLSEHLFVLHYICKREGNTDSNKNHRNGRTRTFDTLALRSTALPLSYVPRGRQQAFACCLVGFDVSRRPYAFGLIHATIISRKYPFVVTHFFIFLSGAFLSFPLNHTVCICHRKHER